MMIGKYLRLKMVMLIVTNWVMMLPSVSLKFGVYDLFNGEVRDGRSIYFFIDKNDGAVYKPASYKAPAKGVRFYINQLADNPAVCDPYGSFLYKR